VSTSPGSEPSEEGEPLLGTRRQARELALSLLYEADAKDSPPAAVLADFPIEPDAFASDLVAGVGTHQDEIDGFIRRFAKDWTLERMPVVDRNLLRIGVYELLHRPDVPTAVVISEAVELARRYSTEESGRFVNGMLGRIAEEVRPA
jgi:N utilization substance protein B